MRHQYTPVFREFTTSSMWAKSPAIRCVWMWLMLNADPEGYVPGTIPGIAIAANVTEEEAREAFALFQAPDPDSSTPDFEGRRLVKVDRGWHLINFVAHRERAKQEAEKARKRRWAQKNYEETRQLSLPGIETQGLSQVIDCNAELNDIFLADSGEPLVAPKPKPIPKPREEEGTPLPPAGLPRTADTATVRSLVLDKLPDDWELSDELRADAVIAGVPPADIDLRINDLRLGPIGGTRGIFAHKLNDYIKRQFPKWRSWAETDRAKALSRAAKGAPKRFGGGEPPLEPTERERGHARKHGYDIDELFRALNEQDCVTRLGRAGAHEEAKRRMAAAAKAAKERAA